MNSAERARSSVSHSLGMSPSAARKPVAKYCSRCFWRSTRGSWARMASGVIPGGFPRCKSYEMVRKLRTEHHPMTSESGATLLGELLEHQATGEIAVIYDEVRRFSGVPYVSSLQRYLATMPGVLEWAWGAVRPALVSGIIQETGWRLAREVRISPLPRVSTARSEEHTSEL